METRKFKKLRLSLTDTCNMACTYCVPENHANDIRSQLKPTLTVADMVDIVKVLHNELNLEKIRITGGEPLMYPHVVHLIKQVKDCGIEDIALTTNAFYLEKLAPRLREAGLKSINISLDALDENVFEKMTRKRMLKQTLKGIYAAKEVGFDLKINSVILKGINDHQVISLLQFGMKHDIPVRFLELMKMGYLHHNYNDYFYSQEEILEEIHQVYPTHKKLRIASATANYWEINEGNYEFGIIANESEPFCKDCDRLRLDSYGKLYGCISAVKGLSVLKKIKQGESINKELMMALKQKQPLRFIGNEMSMRHIGG